MFGERLKQLRKMKKLTQGELADCIGLDRSSIGKYESASALPSNAVLLAIASFFNVSVDCLLGRAPMPEYEPEEKTERRGKKIPVLGDIAAGIPIFASEDIIGYEDIDEDTARRGEFFALRVSGHSMEPKISPGDTLIVRSATDCKDGEVAVVLIGDEASCKRVFKKPEGLWLISDNSADTAPMFFTKKEVREKPVLIQGVVVQLRSDINGGI